MVAADTHEPVINRNAFGKMWVLVNRRRYTLQPNLPLYAQGTATSTVIRWQRLTTRTLRRRIIYISSAKSTSVSSGADVCTGHTIKEQPVTQAATEKIQESCCPKPSGRRQRLATKKRFPLVSLLKQMELANNKQIIIIRFKRLTESKILGSIV